MKNNKQLKNGHNRITSLKQTAVAVALSSVASVASADIVIGTTDTTTLSMYGILDVGLLYQDHVTAGGDEKVDVETSGISPTIFGFKGVRKLPGNSNAFFNLEAHFDMDNGYFYDTGDSGSPRVLFRRQANVGLTGDWGTVIVGRQYGPALLAQFATEPRAFKEQFSNVFAWAYSTLSNTALGGDFQNARNDVGIFFSNAVQYRHSINGIDFGVMYSTGGMEGTMQDGQVFAFGAAYNNGPLTLSASFQNMDDDTTGEDVVENWGLGAAYNFGDLTVKTNYMVTENNDKDDGSLLLDLESLSLGVDWRWSPRNSATVAYYMNEDKLSGETNSLVLSNDYKLDDQTTIYAQMAHIDSDATLSTLGQYGTSIVWNPTPVGEKTTMFNVGLNFVF